MFAAKTRPDTPLLRSISTAVEGLISADNQRGKSENLTGNMTDKLRHDILRSVVGFSDDIPHPASGMGGEGLSQTLIRWQILAYVAGIDLTIAKWFESHLDALSILYEVGYDRSASGLWAVWASEGHPDPIRYQPKTSHATTNDPISDTTSDTVTGTINGTKAWCSGANMVDHGLVTYRDSNGQSQLLIVDMQQPGITIDNTDWQAVGMQATDTATVRFNQVAATTVGTANAYLDRVGFWHGAAGVAACWFGAAATLGAYLIKAYQQKPNDYKAMYLGQISTGLTITQQYFHHVAALIDTQPNSSHELIIRQLRAQVEQLARLVIEGVGQALGAAPYCRNGHFSRLAADLAVFIRQSHGAFDLQKIGELTCKLSAPSAPETMVDLINKTDSMNEAINGQDTIWQL